MLHPTEGIVIWLRHLHEAGWLDEREGQLRFLDIVGRAAFTPRQGGGQGGASAP